MRWEMLLPTPAFFPSRFAAEVDATDGEGEGGAVPEDDPSLFKKADPEDVALMPNGLSPSPVADSRERGARAVGFDAERKPW